MMGGVDARGAAVIAGIESLSPCRTFDRPSSMPKAVVAHSLARDGQDRLRGVPIPREEEGFGILDNGIGDLLTALNAFAAPYHPRC